MNFINKLLPIASFVLLLITLFTLICNAWIGTFREYSYSDIDSLPDTKVGLVLGTSKYVAKGVHNLYYNNRMEAAARLFNSGKITHLIVSGDNATKEYNEPIAMKNDLIALGVPESRIYLDYAGFRTLDSVERAKEIFGQNTFIIISQQFHNERALAIARTKGIKAYAYNARAVTGKSGFKTNVREIFARVKTVLDLTILQTKPRFYGEQVQID